ncbi:MAG: substrate-binding domain-containing protein [Eubacterium sp.]|nr:substrate-binding domain-containing protein [Eubacterium sp.]
MLKEAKDAGIPVILVDRDINTKEEGLATCLIGADFYQEGVMAGEYLIRKADALGKSHMKIVEITGTEDSTPMRQRQAGFMDTIRKDGRIRVNVRSVHDLHRRRVPASAADLRPSE